MVLNKRRLQEKQDRHESILDAAEKVFFSKGYDKCSMEEIARGAELSRALLYVYFKDKSAIMRGIMLRAAESICARFEQALARGQRGNEQITEIGDAYYRFSLEEPNYFDVLTHANVFPHLSTADQMSEDLLTCSTHAMQVMVTALENGVRDGSLCAKRVSNPLQTAYYLRGALHGVIMQCSELNEHQSSLPGHPEPAELVSYTLRMLTRSMQP